MAARPLPQLRLDAPRAEWLRYFNHGWQLTELLFSGLADEEAFYRRPWHGLRHPMIFYYVHPAVLYVNKLRVAGLWELEVHPHFERLFETGVDEMRWDDLHDDNADIWPKLAEARAYRETVRERITRLIETHPALDDGPITPSSPLWALAMGFEHERIHLETSSVLIRELPPECVRTPHVWPAFRSKQAQPPHAPVMGVDYPAPHFIRMEKTRVTIGKDAAHPTFGWDNEYGREVRDVAPFEAGSCLVSNAEFHAFVASGGYLQRAHWMEEGWNWRGFRNNKHPVFWVPDGPAGLHRYRLRTVFETIPMQWDWPVIVNFHEAKAYAAWRGAQDAIPYRLLYEAEHHALRDASEPLASANLDLASGAESPVHATPANSKGFHDVFGNVWQWCEDPFHPLPGFAPHRYYDDFSVPCFDGRHQMIQGGSFISTGDEASRFARFHFRPHFFQHAGFRLVRGGEERAACGPARYETASMLNRYLLMHWGADHEIHAPFVPVPPVSHLPLLLAEQAVLHASAFGSALDLGCAVGRTAFELARRFDRVTGIDYSHEFVRAADTIRSKGRLDYQRDDGCGVFTPLAATPDPSIPRERLRFAVGDACALPEEYRAFDAVILANVLCRLPDPAACLARMPDLLTPHGVLVMTTPFSWLAEYTEPQHWLPDETAIARHLPDFDLIHAEDVTFLLREHPRKYEYIIPRLTVWRRR